MADTLDDKLRGVMAVVLKVPVATIDENSSPDNIATWDSIAHINLTMALEGEFGISFTDEQVVGMLNYELIRATVAEALAASA